MFRKIFQPREILVSLCKRDVVYRIPLWEKIVPESIVVKVDKGYLEIKMGLENPPAEKSPAGMGVERNTHGENAMCVSTEPLSLR